MPQEEITMFTALKNYADQNGITLDESELAALDDEVAALEEAARSYGYSNANRFLAAQYGTGVNVRLARALMAESALASKAMQTYSDSLSFSDEELEESYNFLPTDLYLASIRNSGADILFRLGVDTWSSCSWKKMPA